MVFGDVNKVRSWMSRPQKKMGNKSVFEALKTAEGCKKVQARLIQIAHGFIC